MSGTALGELGGVIGVAGCLLVIFEARLPVRVRAKRPGRALLVVGFLMALAGLLARQFSN
jgi:hypothetical protein